jgi:redox-sensitive bicupin YhaK (pirin superfamily)
VPGFPAHPHRGFETVTLVRQGLIDHADSLGAAARFGGGDVQWVTAGRGIVHSEMFALLDTAAPNPLELFQVWLNLPARSKMAAPHFTMFWNERIPRLVHHDDQGRATTVTVVAGALSGAQAPLPPPPESWAAQSGSDVAIWTLHLAPGAQWQLPAAQGGQTRRMLYFFVGESLRIGAQEVREHAALQLQAGQDWLLTNTGTTVLECLLLQGRPIAEPVAQYGPFVMNTQAEIAQALQDYRRTQFGGWPWPDSAPVHGAQARRFARYPGQAAHEVPGPPANAATGAH